MKEILITSSVLILALLLLLLIFGKNVRRTLRICFANPFAAAHVNTEGELLAFSPSPVFQQAAAECVMGMFEPVGKLPMKL